MRNEFKVVEISPMYQMKGLKMKYTGAEEIEKKIVDLGLLGWNLISTSVANMNGSTYKTFLYFSRPMESLEEMV